MDDRGERLLRHASELQKTWEVGALAQLRDAQLDRAGAGFPEPIAVAIALNEPLGAPLAVRRAGQLAHFQLPWRAGAPPSRRRSSPGQEAREAGAGRQNGSSRQGARHREPSRSRPASSSSRRSSTVSRPDWSSNLILPAPSMTAAQPPARQPARGALAGGFATAELHHQPGHDPPPRRPTEGPITTESARSGRQHRPDDRRADLRLAWAGEVGWPPPRPGSSLPCAGSRPTSSPRQPLGRSPRRLARSTARGTPTPNRLMGLPTGQVHGPAGWHGAEWVPSAPPRCTAQVTRDGIEGTPRRPRSGAPTRPPRSGRPPPRGAGRPRRHFPRGTGASPRRRCRRGTG